MNTKRIFSTIAISAAALAVAGAAQAAPSFSFTTITGSDTVVGGGSNVITFDGSGPAYLLSGNYQVLSSSVNNEAAMPQGTVGNYLVVPATGAAGGLGGYTATLTLLTPLADATTLSFLWGTVDTFNSVTINQTDGSSFTINGSSFTPADGTTTARVDVTGLTGVSSITFSDITSSANSSFRAFEVDTISIGSAVPEPAIWGMMVLGFGVVGAALRSSRRKVIFA